MELAASRVPKSTWCWLYGRRSSCRHAKYKNYKFMAVWHRARKNPWGQATCQQGQSLLDQCMKLWRSLSIIGDSYIKRIPRTWDVCWWKLQQLNGAVSRESHVCCVQQDHKDKATRFQWNSNDAIMHSDAGLESSVVLLVWSMLGSF